MTNQEVEALASTYWSEVPDPPIYPRNLETSVCWGYPVVVLTMADLMLSAVHSWLAARGIMRDSVRRDRPLHACLAAIRGQGFVFLNGTDPEDQRRFSLAHEIAHFILDYYLPRRRAIGVFGNSIVAVLDGDRQATIGERLTGSLRSVTLGSFDHLMDRDAGGIARSIQIVEAEDNADRLALELLAPRREVLAKLKRSRQTGRSPTPENVREILIEFFGLPQEVAIQYARALTAWQMKKRSFRDWIGK